MLNLAPRIEGLQCKTPAKGMVKLAACRVRRKAPTYGSSTAPRATRGLCYPELWFGDDLAMRRVGLAALVLSVLAGSPAAAKDCDRTCMAAGTDAALAALQAGDPGKVLRGVRVTENGRDIRLPDSQLHAIRRVTYTHVFLEPAAGAAGVYGAAEAAGGPEIFSLRLKLKGERITEAETVVVRRGEASVFSAQTMAAKPEWDQELAPARRTPREAMIAAANAYFDGIEAASGANVPAAPTCDR